MRHLCADYGALYWHHQTRDQRQHLEISLEIYENMLGDTKRARDERLRKAGLHIRTSCDT